ncbi:MAG: hypothetical protein K0U93_23010 [Gammaproteobacteria bacterium]|nr:hypothetical protein [Gammaproteobacteria bacterium]
MAKLLLRHFLQVFVIPSAAVTFAWFGFIASDVLPEWSLIEFGVLGLAFIVIAELFAQRVNAPALLAVAFLVLAAGAAALPVYFIVVGIDVNVHGILDYGGLVLTSFFAAAFTAHWRLYRSGYTALDIVETTGNLPKGSLSGLLKKGPHKSE